MLRLYTGDEGQSHFQDLDLDTFPAEWSFQVPNAKINFTRHRGDGYQMIDWHNVTRRENPFAPLMIVLTE